jgi:hypothetical protein
LCWGGLKIGSHELFIQICPGMTLN